MPSSLNKPQKVSLCKILLNTVVVYQTEPLVGEVAHPHNPSSFLSLLHKFPFINHTSISSPHLVHHYTQNQKPKDLHLLHLLTHHYTEISTETQKSVMARLQNELGAALVLLALFIAGASAQSSCSNVLISLSPCLNYITGNSSTPSSGCCTQLASVVKSNPECLCQVLGGGSSSLGISINQTRALALPGTCNVQTPSLSRCNGKTSYEL